MQGAKIVGFIRFSWIALNRQEWRQTSSKSVADIASILFDQKRMESRFKYFENICLPSIALLNEPNSHVVLFTSSLMPTEYRQRLKGLTQPYDHILVVETAPMEMVAACRLALSQLDLTAYESVALSQLDLTAYESVITYRLDDDDAVFAFFDRYLLENYSSSRFHGMDRSIFGGHRWITGASAGLAYIESTKSIRTVFFTGNHMTTARCFPTVLDPRRIGWVRVKHDTNDSGEKQLSEDKFGPEFFSQDLAKFFPWWENLWAING